MDHSYNYPVHAQSNTTRDGILLAIERADLRDSTKTKYLREVEKYLATGASLTDP